MGAKDGAIDLTDLFADGRQPSFEEIRRAYDGDVEVTEDEAAVFEIMER